MKIIYRPNRKKSISLTEQTNTQQNHQYSRSLGYTHKE